MASYIDGVKYNVRMALELDTENKLQEAYIQYLVSVQLISSCLLQEVKQIGFYATSANKMSLRLGYKCMDRLQNMISSLIPEAPHVSSLLTSQSPDSIRLFSSSPSTSYTENSLGRQPIDKTRLPNTLSDDGTRLPRTPSEEMSRLARTPSDEGASLPRSHTLPLIPLPLVSHQQKAEGHKLGFEKMNKPVALNEVISNAPNAHMAQARNQNKLLMTAYQSRMAKLHPDKTNANSMSLRLQRQMIENMELAKSRKKAFEKKMAERQDRLEKEAVRKFGSTTGMSEIEQERLKLYTKVMLYEQDQKWQDWRKRLDDDPDNLKLQQDLITEILRNDDHPLNILLKQYQYSIYDALHPVVSQQLHRIKLIKVPYVKPTEEKTVSDQRVEILEQEAIERHLTTITRDIQEKFDNLIMLFMMAYEVLDSPSGRENCYACIEEPFFTPIWAYLLALFRMSNKSNEIELVESMTEYCDSPLQVIGVGELFCPQDNCLQDDSYPYEAAVRTLSSISQLVCPLKKLECIVLVCRGICDCVEKYNVSKERTPSVGADDLLPLLSYVVIRSEFPQIVSECHLLETFIHESYLMGEEGYCLTSLQTAIGYVSRINERMENERNERTSTEIP